jgi:hypothetical protein
VRVVTPVVVVAAAELRPVVGTPVTVATEAVAITPAAEVGRGPAWGGAVRASRGGGSRQHQARSHQAQVTDGEWFLAWAGCACLCQQDGLNRNSP